MSGPRDHLVVLNPAADRGRAAGAAPRIEAAFGQAGARYELVRTAGPGEAAFLAERAAREGRGAVVAVGGDGVVHEVANGLLRAAGEGPTVPMGVVAVGSGNDFVKMLGLPARDPSAAVARLLRGVPRAVDVGRVSRSVGPDGPLPTWYFTNGVGLGFDAQVAREARGIRRLRGSAIYAWALPRVELHRARTVELRSDEPLPIHADGEIVAEWVRELEIEVLPGRLRVLV